MVAVAGGAVTYNPWSAIIVGFIAALSFLLWSKLLIKLHVDDPVETAAGKEENWAWFSLISLSCLIVHIGGGLWGIFAVPIFRRTIEAQPDGSFANNTFSIIYRITLGESWRVRTYQNKLIYLFNIYIYIGITQFIMHCSCSHGLDSYLCCYSLPSA